MLKLNPPSFFQHFVWLPVRVFMHVCCSVRIEGIEHVRAVKGNVIFASNHVTELDPLLIVASLPFFSNKLPIIYVVMEKKVYAESWKGWKKYLYGGHFFRLIGGYESYSGLRNYNRALCHHVRAAKEGESIGIFPVGKRHTAQDIQQAKGGVSFLVRETKSPVLPIRIEGIDRKTTLEDYVLRKPRLKITFGKAIYEHEYFYAFNADLHENDLFKEASRSLMEKIVKL
jgi:1-acyl-sn-glycerol-3-phosphate acyltransferase